MEEGVNQELNIVVNEEVRRFHAKTLISFFLVIMFLFLLSVFLLSCHVCAIIPFPYCE